jgi:DNA-directed RNA polymerase subunit D
MMVQKQRVAKGVEGFKRIVDAMKVTSTDFKGSKGTIELTDTDVYFVNALRRVMIADLPKLAIQDVIIYDNTSPLFDEIIAHRLGMIPIPTDLQLLIFRNDCTCKGKGCPSCTVRYTLSKEDEGPVLSGDLQPETEQWAIQEDKIPIVELGKDQRIILEVEAVLGRGRDHAKWQAVQAPTYRMKTEITFDVKRIEDVKEFIKELPAGIVELKNNKVVLLDVTRLPVLQSAYDKIDDDFLTISRDQHTLSFSFETDGAFSAKDALQESIKILKSKFDEFSTLLKDIK